MSWIAVGVGAAVGLAGGGLKAKGDTDRETRQLKRESTKDRYSFITGQQGGQVEASNPWGDIVGGLFSGAQGGAAFGTGMAGADYTKAATDWLKNGGNPAYTGALAASGAYGPASGLNYNQSPGSFWGVDMYPGGAQKLQAAQSSSPWGIASAGYAPASKNKYSLFGQ